MNDASLRFSERTQTDPADFFFSAMKARSALDFNDQTEAVFDIDDASSIEVLEMVSQLGVELNDDLSVRASRSLCFDRSE